ncbi:MAG: type II toxin-antitoxin system RelE/ParE family toxin [Planctomycetota bacterium]|nr:type II toxin-antitoxin system RelE/ParE family toxin [Planctomycetota bacterium]
MPYRVIFQPSAARQVRALSPELYRRVIAKAESLAANPRPAGCQKLKGMDATWRVRVGDYRVIYEIRDEVLVVLVVRIGHRRDVYRGR